MKVEQASIPGCPAGTSPADAPNRTEVAILVCRTCRDSAGTEAAPRPGAVLAEATAALGAKAGVPVVAIDCLGNCKRRLSAAILRRGAWTYVFGDLSASNAEDLVAGALLLSSSADGLLPWRGRPDCLRRGLVARIPSFDMIGPSQ